MIVRKEIDPDKQPLTAAQKKMLQALKDRPITPDEDNPILSAEQLTYFIGVSAQNKKQYPTHDTK